MLAAFAVRTDPDDPLSGLEVGERPEPRPLAGWTTVRLRAASLNHHDLWSLQGVGLPADRLPMVLGCDGAGVDEDGNEVVVHAVISDPDHRGDETLDPKRSLLSERYDGTLADLVAVPRRNLVPKPTQLSFEEAACLPTAWLTAYRMLFTQAAAQPGQTVLVQGAGGGVATALVAIGRAAGLRMWVTSRDGSKRERSLAARRRPGLRVRRPAARAGRRGDGDRRRADLGPQPQVARPGRHPRRVREQPAGTRPSPTCVGCSSCSSGSSAPPWAPATSWAGWCG